MTDTTIEPTHWEVRPEGIEQTLFTDPDSFYLHIRHSQWHDERTFIVYAGSSNFGCFTKAGALVRLRHDVNAKHAHHATFEEACETARGLAEGRIKSVNYRTWREAEARRPDLVRPGQVG